MPNCQWFGTLEDHRVIFQHVLEGGEYDVLQSYSDVGEGLSVLHNFDQIARVFAPSEAGNSPRSNAQFMLWVHGSGPAPEVARIPLMVDGRAAWRESCGPMGCITLTAHVPVGNSLFYSTANAVSEARMGAVDGKFVDTLNGNTWDMRMVNRKSAALNRFIRRQAVARLNTVFVLPGAMRIWDVDGAMGPWSRTKTPGALLML